MKNYADEPTDPRFHRPFVHQHHIMDHDRPTASAKGHGYRNKSTYPLTAAMTDTSKPATSHVEGRASETAKPYEAEVSHAEKGTGGQRFSEGTAVGEHGLHRKDSHKPDLVSNTNARLANPLGDLTDEEVQNNARAFAEANGLPAETFQKGALVAKRPLRFEQMKILSEEDKEKLRREISHPYDQPRILYQLVIACSLAAAVQGGWCAHL